ncbi:MAG: PEP-CTERM sorting domain-containing protein [Akkermansiaceae bacterium]|nr:PEP-CTERM sorting domain-containing protein [Akkermansiaceae bacterium]
MKIMPPQARSLTAAILTIGSLVGGVNAATTVGFSNFTATTSVTPQAGFPISMINDGITGTASSLNGFASNSLGVISFSLNQDYNLSSFLLWNDIVVNNEGIDDFSLRFYDSSDLLITTSAATNYVGPVGQVAVREYIFPSSVMGVRRVELDVASGQLGTRIEIREVDFGVVPEPTSATLLGLGCLGLMLRRSRK